VLDAAASLVPHLRLVEVAAVNHYTIAMDVVGARVIAAATREALSSASEPLAKEPT
jgi:hypothetical protein